jgi:hypothetical protein
MRCDRIFRDPVIGPYMMTGQYGDVVESVGLLAITWCVRSPIPA